MNLPETVSWIEVVWTVPSALALLLAMVMHRESWLDLQILRRQSWNGIALIQARGYFRNASLTVVELGVMTSLGVFALTQPAEPADSGPPVSAIALALTLLFVGLPLILLVREVRARQDRQRIRRLLDAGYG